MGNPASDERLLADLADGKLDTFEELVLRYQHRLYAFCLRMLGSAADAEEVAQDVFVHAFRAISREYAPEQVRTLALRPWLYRIALNLVRNRLRCRPPNQVALLPDDDGSVDAPGFLPAPDGDQPESRAIDGETRAELAAALLALPERYRSAIVLRHVQGFSYAEVADVLGLPVGTVKSDVHRGLALLRQSLQMMKQEALT